MAVLNFLKESILNLFTRWENYAVIEVLEDRVQVGFIKADLNKKRIKIIKTKIKYFDKSGIHHILEAIKSIFKKTGKFSNYKFILCLNPELATTIYSSVSIMRSQPKDVIDDADLDNLISDGVWRLFDRERLKAAKKMNTDDINVLLSDVRIKGIKIDGHKVVNPIGFKAKSVEILLSQTFVVRDFIKGIREILSSDKIVFIAEGGTALANIILNSIAEKNSFLLANLFFQKTSIFSASVERIAFARDLDWGEINLLEGMRDNLFLDNETARLVLACYLKGAGSPDFLRRLESIMAEELKLLIKKLDAAASRSEQIYFNPYFNLPRIVFEPRFQLRSAKGLKFTSLSIDSVAEKAGFEVKYRELAKANNILTITAVFFEFSSLPSGDKLSHLANRRVRWLAN